MHMYFLFKQLNEFLLISSCYYLAELISALPMSVEMHKKWMMQRVSAVE